MFLIALVLAVDAAFVAVYFLANVRSAPDAGKLLFTAIWTVAILLIAIRGLSRIRSSRLHQPLD